MSGICGMYYLDNRPVNRAVLDRMTEGVAYRGPDAANVWAEGSIGLGHRMLWTTPESLQEHQPMLSEDGRLCLTADARVDNREELRAQLEAQGIRFRADTDAELILRAYEVWGEECPKKILGDFAFAIWDDRQKRVFCARDPFGIKPFYYHFDGKSFRWASDPRAILEDSSITREPNVALIFEYMLGRFEGGEETLYRGIQRLSPAHYLVLEHGRLRKGRYWDIDPEHQIRYKSDSEYAEHFLDLFGAAVRARLRSHGPVGALLSGGLDSSSIVCTAQKLYQERAIPQNGFESFSMIFDEFPCDERQYIQKVVDKWRVRANYIPYEKNLSWIDLDRARQFPDFFPTANFYMLAPLFQQAEAKGIRVMLDGRGGDELLAAGFNHLTDLMRQGNVRKLWARLRDDAALSSRSLRYLFFSYCVRPLIPRPVKVVLRPILHPFGRNGIPSWVSASLFGELNAGNRLRIEAPVKRFPTYAQQRMYAELFSGFNNTVALGMAEAFAARFGIESRRPFFDRRVVQFMIALPDEQRWRGQWMKAILRHAMEGILPELVRNRTGAADFSPMIDHELKDRQLDKLEGLIRTSTLSTLGVVNSEGFLRLFDDFRRGRAHPSARWTIGTFVWLELWCKAHVGRPIPGRANIAMAGCRDEPATAASAS